jgi:hypothetical protein
MPTTHRTPCPAWMQQFRLGDRSGGVDSTGILLRWLTDSSSRNFPLLELTVLFSQIGDEYPDTYHAIERHVLPALRARRVRLVQLARPGPLQCSAARLRQT